MAISRLSRRNFYEALISLAIVLLLMGFVLQFLIYRQMGVWLDDRDRGVNPLDPHLGRRSGDGRSEDPTLRDDHISGERTTVVVNVNVSRLSKDDCRDRDNDSPKQTAT